jgi:penicillin-binding protein 1B
MAKKPEKPASEKGAAKPKAKAKTVKKPKAAKSGGGGGGGRPWLRWIAMEALTWGGGAALGAGIVAAVLWGRAREDVDAFLEQPSRARPGIVYSAPMEVREGQAATLSDIAGELLAAGYERVPKVTADDQFSLAADRIEVRTSALHGPGFDVAASRVTITVTADGFVQDVEPGQKATLHPTVLGTIGDPEGRRAKVTLETCSPWVEKAIVAMEDSRFRSHHGVDPMGVMRALVHNARSESGTHGGSTLTQQLAKNLFLSPERTLQRKVREVFFALALESTLTKDQILELYLQEVYLGQAGGVPLYGVEAASRAWFGVSAQSLTVDEAATIAGVISAPNSYSPLRHPETAKERRDITIDRMATMGFLAAAEAEDAKATDLKIDGALPGAVRRAPWAMDAAVEIAEAAVGEGALSSRGYRVYTTIQPLAQRAAERAVRDGIAEMEDEYPRAVGSEAALVAMDPDDGAVIALVGGRDYVRSPFDRGRDAWREVGSIVKPLTMLAAFDANDDLTPLSRLDDSPISRDVDGKNWTPTNYDGTFHGEVTLRQAIEASLNIPAIRLSEAVGLEALQAFLRKCGLTRSTNYPSVALGAFAATPLEVASAYTVFPGGGTRHEPLLVLGIADANGDELVVFSPRPHAVATARSSAMSTAVLQGVITDGTGARARGYGVSGAVGAKTGTTNDYRDAWMVGFTPHLVTAVWVGRDKGENLGLSGSRAALPTWARFVAAQGPVNDIFGLPDGLVHQAVCADSRRLAVPACPDRYAEVLPKDKVPTKKCDLHGGPKVDVSRILGGLFRRGGASEDPPKPE